MTKKATTVTTSTTPNHIVNLADIGSLKSTCGRNIRVLELKIEADDSYISDWARHFRQSYCPDCDIDLLREKLSRRDYLQTMVFPHATQKPGPSIRSGDFAELLISDLLEYIDGFWVPRYKYQDKASPNESVKGSDVLGFKKVKEDSEAEDDTLIVCEVKAQLTGSKYNRRLKTAIADSSKDIGHLRLATTLNALKRRAKNGNLMDKVHLISRFQRKTDSQFILKSSAIAVLTETVYDAAGIADVDCSTHANEKNLELIVVRGKDLMQLVHKLYEVAANEA